MSTETNNIKSFAEHMKVNTPSKDFTSVIKTQNFIKENFKFSIDQAIQARVHLGASKINKDMESYVYSSLNAGQSDSTFINLDITFEVLSILFKRIEEIIASGNSILIVGGGSTERKEMIEKFANEATSPFVITRISPGMITNNQQVIVSGLKRMKEHEMLLEKNKFTTSAEKSKIKHLFKSEQKNMGGLVNLSSKKIGALLVLQGINGLDSLLHEASKKNILTIGLCDTNSPTLNLNYIIPCNITSDASVQYILDTLLPAFKNGHSMCAESQREHTVVKPHFTKKY